MLFQCYFDISNNYKIYFLFTINKHTRYLDEQRERQRGAALSGQKGSGANGGQQAEALSDVRGGMVRLQVPHPARLATAQ